MTSNNQINGKQTSMLTQVFGANSITSNEHLMLDPGQLNSNEQRHAALASLFSSLSSLTANPQMQVVAASANNYQQNLTIPPPPLQPPPQLAPAATTAPVMAPSSPVFNASSSASMSLTSSIQSFVAAAMMQQQLVTAALKQQQQQSQVHITTPPPQPQQQQQQPISYLGEQMRNDFTLNVTDFDHQDVQLSGFNQSQVQQLQQQPQEQQQQQQQQQRINYCTICNKELCNKYFMKTHMLKMHGINLETEQPEEGNATDQGSNESEGQPDSEDLDAGNNSHSNKSSQNSSNKTTTNKKVGSPSSLMKKSTNTSQGKHHQQATTSVMNGFAGNSMGGVVCDICNKELCSKYFLKVHKQNTHGVNTDTQDASQFMYPFAPNPFMAAAPIGLTPPAALGLATNPVALLNGQQPSEGQTQVEAKSLSPSVKRPKYMTQHSQDNSNLPEPKKESSHRKGHIGRQTNNDTSAYRLNMAVTQQQQRQIAAGGQPLGPPMVPALDAGALGPTPMPYCFGALNPFVPKLTPAMIVDYILQNQHLFNRINRNDSNNDNTNPGDPTKQSSNHKSPATEQSKQKSKSAKDSPSGTNSNGKYFNHYTEACPMCDRRFKSIKWLKTHMMNDHKQEIGAYMQMMMPYMPYSPSQQQQQQMAAAAMAARSMTNTLGQQQQQQQNHHHHQQQQNNSQSKPQLIFQHQAHCGDKQTQMQMKPNVPVAAKCYNQSPTPSQAHSPINFISQLQEQLIRRSPTETSLASSTVYNQDHLIIDARRRHDSISPGSQSNNNNNNNNFNDVIKLETTTTSSQLELNFELEHLRQQDDNLNIDQFNPSNDSFDDNDDSDHHQSPIEYSANTPKVGKQRLVHLASGVFRSGEEADNDDGEQEDDEQLEVKDLTRGSGGSSSAGGASVRIKTSTS